MISPATLKLVEGYFVYQTLGSHILEELSQPLAVYQVFQESGVESRFAAAVTIGLTPFVGRREEVGLLRERWEQVKARPGAGGVAQWRGGDWQISPRAGTPRARQRKGGMRRLSIAALPITRIVLYIPWLQVQRWLQWNQDDTPQGKLRKLAAALAPYDVMRQEAIPLWRRCYCCPLRRLSSAQADATAAETEDARSLAGVVPATGRDTACVLYHRRSPLGRSSTLELLGLLIDQVQTSRTLLSAFRPDFRPPWSMRTYMTHIAHRPSHPPTG